MNRNEFGFPVVDKLAQAIEIAAGASERIKNVPCTCVECVKAMNLPAVQRILAAYEPLHRSAL